MELSAALNEIAALRTQNQSLRANLETVQFQLAQLQRMIFGHRREQLNIDAHTGLLFEVDPPPPPEPVKREVAVTPKKKPVRENLPAHLPREVTIIDLPEDQKPCPCCGGERHVIGEIVSEKLDYVPATLKVLETRRPKYACRPCEGEVAVAPLPPSPIEQGMAAPGLLAHVLVSKFADHLPLNRQEAILRRHGIELPRSTLCDWVMACADLLVPLYHHLIAHILTGDILHSDDTNLVTQTDVFPRKLIESPRFGERRVGLASTLLWFKCSPLSRSTLLAPSGQVGGIDTLPAQQGADLARYLAAVSGG